MPCVVAHFQFIIPCFILILFCMLYMYANVLYKR